MRPVDLQPALFQTPNVERTGQQQVANPQTAQQAFAAEMQRQAGVRPSQVQTLEPGQEAKPGAVKPEEHGERRQRRQRRRAPVGSAGGGGGPSPATSAGSPTTAGSGGVRVTSTGEAGRKVDDSGEPPAPGSRIDWVI